MSEKNKLTEERFTYTIESDGGIVIEDNETNEHWYCYDYDIGKIISRLNKQDKVIRQQDLTIAKQNNEINFLKYRCNIFEEIIDIPRDIDLCKEQSIVDIAFYCKRYHDYRCIPYCSNERHCYKSDKTFAEKYEEIKEKYDD